MKNTFKVTLIRNPYLDSAIKILAVLSVFQAFYLNRLAVAVLALTGVLLGLRFFLWRPITAMRNFGISLSYIGYMALTVHFLLEALRISGGFNPIGTVSLHVFAFLCMGIVISAMMIRISQGHTGRKLNFARTDQMAIALILIAAFCRLIATQIWPVSYAMWIQLAALGWALSFLLLAYRLGPFLLQPRVDGREH